MKTTFTGKLSFLMICLLLSLGSFAQEVISDDFLENLEKNAKPKWAELESQFASNTVPAKYKDESAVVLGYSRAVTIDKKSRNGFLSRGERSLLFFENVRFKISLNDKNAVNAFTTVYFRFNDKEDGFSARLIKPDGTTSAVVLDDAVGVETYADMPEFYKSFFDQQVGSQRRYYKVAIPDLQPGDILEYVTVTKSKLDVMSNGYIEFTPQYEVCNKAYPILFNQISIDTDDKSYFKSMALNGAPEFKKENASEPGFFHYVFTDRDRGVEKDVDFVNIYQTYPLNKFQVIYANKDNVKGALIGGKGEIKSGFSKEELARKAWEDYVMVGDMPYKQITVQKQIDQIWSNLKRLGSKDWSDKMYITRVYYNIRNLAVNSDTYLPDKVAAYMFGSLLFQRKIKSDLIISISKNVGTLKDVLFDGEIRYLCRVGDKYYFNPTDYSNPGDLVENLMGSDAYVIQEPVKKTGEQSIEPIVLPQQGYSKNISNYVIKSSLATDMKTMIVERTDSYTGINKNRQISDELKYIPYILTDYKYYGDEDPTDKMRESQAEEYNKSVKALKDRYKEAKPEYVKSELQSEYGQRVVYKNYTLKSDGRSEKDSMLIGVREFELQNMVRKAGKKYLVNISGLVGSQLQIKNDQRTRVHDINVGYSRTLNWVINFKVPAGYTVEGIKELNNKVDNSAGTFECIAEEKDGNVVLTIHKVYKEAFMKKDKWPEMLAFVDAAYNNTYRYILLKPKN